MTVYCFDQDRLNKARTDYAIELIDKYKMDKQQAIVNAMTVKHFMQSDAAKKNKLIVEVDKK